MQIVISVYFYLGKNTRSLFTYYDSFVLMLEFVSQQSAMMLAENNNRIGYILKSGYRTIATATFDIIGYAYLIAKSVKLQ